jgi:hypothetical protein
VPCQIPHDHEEHDDGEDEQHNTKIHERLRPNEMRM